MDSRDAAEVRRKPTSVIRNDTSLREAWAAFLHGERPGALTPPRLP